MASERLDPPIATSTPMSAIPSARPVVIPRARSTLCLNNGRGL
jgi:hypothetical protein